MTIRPLEAKAIGCRRTPASIVLPLSSLTRLVKNSVIISDARVAVSAFSICLLHVNHPSGIERGTSRENSSSLGAAGGVI